MFSGCRSPSKTVQFFADSSEVCAVSKKLKSKDPIPNSSRVLGPLACGRRNQKVRSDDSLWVSKQWEVTRRFWSEEILPLM